MATYHLTNGSKVELYSDADLFLAEHTTKDEKVHTFIAENRCIIVATVRTLAPFQTSESRHVPYGY